MPCKAPLIPTMTFQMSPPLKFCGVWVSSSHSSPSFSFQVPRALSKVWTIQLSPIFHTPQLRVPTWDAFFAAPMDSHHTDGGQDLLGEGDEHTAEQAEEALAALAGVVTLDAEAHLHHAPA